MTETTKRRRTRWLWIGAALLLALGVTAVLAPLPNDPVLDSVMKVAKAHGLQSVEPNELESVRERVRNPLRLSNLPSWKKPPPSILYSVSDKTEAEFDALARDVETALMKSSTGGVSGGSGESWTNGRLTAARRRIGITNGETRFQAEVAIEAADTERSMLFLAITRDQPSLWQLIKRKFAGITGGP
jgi:hypothetical protein